MLYDDAPNTPPGTTGRPGVPGTTARAPQGTTILGQLVGRTIPSGDALNNVVLFIMNDHHTYVMRRPQDLKNDQELKACIEYVRKDQFVDAYRLLRVEVCEGRVDVERKLPVTLTFNDWAANQKGTTYFLPVSEVATLYVNALLWSFGEDVRYYVLDERNPLDLHGPLGRFRGSEPHGLWERLRRKKHREGYLDDAPEKERSYTVGIAEALMFEFIAVEHGAMIQNLGLMAQALGLGGFPHYAAHPYAWFKALEFEMIDPDPKYSETVGGGLLTWLAIKWNCAKDIPIPTACNFNPKWGLRAPACENTRYPSIEDAIRDYASDKLARDNARLRDLDDHAWIRGDLAASVLKAIPPFSQKTLETTIAYCEYIQKRYGMFPAHGGPFRTSLAFQAHHVDLDFYDKYYRPEATSETQREHDANWHAQRPPA